MTGQSARTLDSALLRRSLVWRTFMSWICSIALKRLSRTQFRLGPGVVETLRKRFNMPRQK